MNNRQLPRVGTAIDRHGMFAPLMDRGSARREPRQLPLALQCAPARGEPCPAAPGAAACSRLRQNLYGTTALAQEHGDQHTDRRQRLTSAN